ncbi:hypothetical protein [Dyadobacter sp. CY312]|uniref:hypothetical protein n=1 Tax=Dyadobacter sp. CY312 TaxID=2907303 RepID=UPI001F306EBD|nr:hypothetical protein [Dyadobacter sp. CY312]MCE7040025.1 hypothetical protein [Dyadobacter sp. CY312]
MMKADKFSFGFVFLICLFIVSCKKDGDALPQVKSLSIKAGEILSSENFYHYAFNPIVIVEPSLKCDTAGGVISCGMAEGAFKINLDNDDTPDIAFSSKIYKTFAKMDGVESKVHLGAFYSMHPFPVNKGDVISNSLEWTTNGTSWGDSLRGKTISYKTGAFIVPQSEMNLWNEEVYMALRKVVGTDTTFGWVQLKIDDFHKVKILQHGCQTN